MEAFLIEGSDESDFSLSTLNSDWLPEFSPHQISIHHSNDEDLLRCDIFDPDIFFADLDVATDHLALCSEASPDGEIDHIAVPDDFANDDFLKFVSEILNEENLDGHSAPLNDYAVLEATEKSLSDALGEACSSSSGEKPSLLCQNIDSPDDQSSNHALTENTIGTSFSSNPNLLSYGKSDRLFEVVTELAHSPVSTLLDSEFIDEAVFDQLKEACKIHDSEDSCSTDQGTEENNGAKETVVDNGSRGRKNLSRDDIDYERGSRNKHLAADDEEDVQMEQYDDVLLCKEDQDGSISCGFKDGALDNRAQGDKKGSNRKQMRAKKKGGEEVVDLRSLLIQCAQAVASFDLRSANELLKKIRLHASQHGDSTQRLAHYFANGLEARLAGTGWQKYKDEIHKRIPSLEILNAFRVYVSAVPFRRASYFVANDAITKLAGKATRIHIIDFGIFFGFQWPNLIQKLSKREGGPPMLRITGIDYPASGFRPAKKVEETGRRLAGYCDRFKVSFQFQAIAKNWQEVTLDELDVESNELVVVNCLYMSRKLLDETVDESNPRDSFFRLIRKLNPDLFIHGIVNGIYNGPFFETRFKEALFHYSSIFDMFEATIPRESTERLLGESHLYATDALNVIACEGKERVERPETYRQWQDRIQRAGFSKLVLDDALVDKVRAGVKGNYHKDFVVFKNSHWMLQGWKGRILYAISCWRSA